MAISLPFIKVLRVTSGWFRVCREGALYLITVIILPKFSITEHQSVPVHSQSDNSLIRLLQSHYLRDERKFDRWGGLGKVLLVQTVLRGKQITPLTGHHLEHLINTAFPRTFTSLKTGSKVLDSAVVRVYYTDVCESLEREGVEPGKAEMLAREEAAEKFCTTGIRIRECLA
jgi:hypothetical protein